MQIDIQAHQFSLTHALRSHAEWQLRFALTYFENNIQRVILRLSGINGPRGGAEKHCHIQVVLKSLPDVVIEDSEADLCIAIDRATDRAGRTVERRLTRQREMAHLSRLHETARVTG